MRSALGLAATATVLASCAGVSFSKAGEEDALAACKSLRILLGEETSIEQGIDAMVRAQVLATRAADANDGYQLLASAMSALNEAMLVGSEDLAQSAWANAARLCNDL